MKELLDATHAILDSPDPAGELTLVDNYFALYLKDPKRFVLPRKHKHLRPLIAHFVRHPLAFMTLVRRMRAYVLERDGETPQYEQLQIFRRRLEVRFAARARRVRATLLKLWMQEHRSDLTAKQRRAWIERIEQHWKEQRLALLAKARRDHRGTLPNDVAGPLLEEFWEQVERDITAGRFPPHQEGADDGLEPFEPHGI